MRAWERLGIELLTRDGIAPDVSLAGARRRRPARIARWSPGATTPLLDAVRDAFGGARAARPTSSSRIDSRAQALARGAAVRQLDRLPGRRACRPSSRYLRALPRHVHHSSSRATATRSKPSAADSDRPRALSQRLATLRMTVLDRFLRYVRRSTRAPTKRRRRVRARPGQLDAAASCSPRELRDDRSDRRRRSTSNGYLMATSRRRSRRATRRRSDSSRTSTRRRRCRATTSRRSSIARGTDATSCCPTIPPRCCAPPIIRISRRRSATTSSPRRGRRCSAPTTRPASRHRRGRRRT